MYERVVIIGYGKIVADVLHMMCERRAGYHYEISCIEYEQMPLAITQKMCEEENIPYYKLPNKEDVTAYFMAIEEKTLVLSAGNNYLFPGKVVDKENLTIINFHNALLPKLPGRNAPTWAIYYGEKETGATWHFVNRDIDAGQIIIQKKCIIDDDVKAYQLTERIMELAAEGFAEIIDDLLMEKDVPVQENPKGDHKLLLSKSIPADGIADLGLPGDNIYRLLRSVDYGKSDIFPPVCAYMNGTAISLIRYKKTQRQYTDQINGLVIVGDQKLLYKYLDEEYELKIKYKEKNEL